MMPCKINLRKDSAAVITVIRVLDAASCRGSDSASQIVRGGELDGMSRKTSFREGPADGSSYVRGSTYVGYG